MYRERERDRKRDHVIPYRVTLHSKDASAEHPLAGRKPCPLRRARVRIPTLKETILPSLGGDPPGFKGVSLKGGFKCHRLFLLQLHLS